MKAFEKEILTLVANYVNKLAGDNDLTAENIQQEAKISITSTGWKVEMDAATFYLTTSPCASQKWLGSKS